MTLAIYDIVDAVASHAAASGWFEQVNTYEARTSPGNGLIAAVWLQQLDPVQSSGLASTSIRIVLNLRMYQNMETEPNDMVDPDMVRALDALVAAYSGDFELGGNARQIDLLGAYGDPLSANAGYLELGSNMFRVMDISIPIVVNDVWTQSP